MDKVIEQEIKKNYILARGFQVPPKADDLKVIVSVWVNEMMSLDRYYKLTDELLVKSWMQARKETEFPSFTDVARAISMVSTFESKHLKRLK